MNIPPRFFVNPGLLNWPKKANIGSSLTKRMKWRSSQMKARKRCIIQISFGFKYKEMTVMIISWDNIIAGYFIVMVIVFILGIIIGRPK